MKGMRRDEKAGCEVCPRQGFCGFQRLKDGPDNR
jgi:hypothetical protein